jgi:hypothetical protein
LALGSELFPLPINPAMDGHLEFMYFEIASMMVGAVFVYFSRRLWTIPMQQQRESPIHARR